MKHSILALGTFDGVHAGHQQLLEKTLELARETGAVPVAYTFSNHPLEAFGKTPKLLMSHEERLEALRQSGCEVAADRFDLAYAASEPEVFARGLVERFHMTAAVAGFNYTFGNKGRGDMALLKSLGKELGFSVCEIPPLLYEGEPVSSTRIRACVLAGEVEAASAMLGRWYALSGEVARGRGIGAGIGFPTANVTYAPDRALPKSGVYATWAEVGGKSYPAVTNVGSNPTVNGQSVTVEAHLLNFSGDLYGQRMQVRFVERLRGDFAFASVDALRTQIEKDAGNAEKILQQQGKNAVYKPGVM